MRANDFTNKVYYTLIINGVAKVTKKDYLALERLAKDYKKAHPKDKIKIVHSQDLPEGLKSAIAKAALAGTLAVTSPNVPSNVPNTDKSIEYMGQGKSFPSTVQVVVDKDGKRRKIYSENMDDDLNEAFFGFGKKKPSTVEEYVKQHGKKWMQDWQEQDPRSQNSPSFLAFTRQIRAELEKAFPNLTPRHIGHDADKEAERILYTVDPNFNGWPIGTQSNLGRLAPGERGFRKPEPRQFRDREIPPADPNQMKLDLDEGDVIQGPWGKKKSTGHVDPYVTQYEQWKENGALETKIGKKVEKEAEGEAHFYYKNHEVSKSAKSYYWILRIVDGYSKTQAINMMLIKYPADRSLEETDSTGMGGGSAGIGGGSMVGGPETYEEEFGPFKRKGKFKRTMAMTY